MTRLRLEPLREVHARAIIKWRYLPPYDFYNAPVDNHTDRYVREFLNPEWAFHAVLDSDDRHIGFCSFGRDGQVPGGDYSLDALDIGLGMTPELTGRGLGVGFFGAILAHAAEHLRPRQCRLTVADFNVRALKLYSKFGFQIQDEFVDERSNMRYRVLVRQC
jgi:[ribosomal protein S18]-alanine N-acetyltransferase